MVEVIVEDTHRLDVNEGFDFSFNYSIADIRTPESRQTEYSKTINCPGTHTNNVLFGHIFDVTAANPYDATAANVGYNFNPNKKAKVVVLIDGLPIFSGSIQLRKIPFSRGLMSYEVVMLGKMIDLFTAIGKKMLNGVDDDGNAFIDFSDLDHTLSAANQQTSWTAQIGSGYVYPLIDYGHSMSISPDGHKAYRVDQLYPAIYVKEIVDRIFQFAGYTYTSSFFGSVMWNRLIIPFSQGTYSITDAENLLLSFLADSIIQQSTTVSLTELVGPGQGFAPNTALRWRLDRLQCTNEIHDSGNNYNSASLQEFTSPSNRQHQFGARIKGTASVTGPGSTTFYQLITCQFHRVRNGLDQIVYDETQTSTEFVTVSSGDSLSYDFSYVSPLIDVEDGDVIYVQVRDYSATILSHTWTHTIDVGSAFYNIPRRDGLVEGETVHMDSVVPDVAMRDLMISLIQMFHLYIEVDPTNDTNLLIEPRDDYYDNSDAVIDWTHKLDRHGKIDITPISTVVSNKYDFAYSEDDDYYNGRYQSTYGRTYGSRRIEIDNDFNTGSKDITVVFSPTPLVNDGQSSRIIPKIYDEDVANGAQTFGANIRILYWGGLKPSQPIWQHAQETVWSGNAATLYQNMDEYPYAGHWDDPINPSIDINFGMAFQLFYTATGYTGAVSYTNANLFNLYHSRHYNEITHKDGKLLTGMFRLRALDISKLNFANLILIDHAYWRLNKVENYNPFKDQLTRVELIKVIDQPDFKATPDIKTLGTTGSGIVRERNPIGRSNAKRNLNDYDPVNGSVRGKGNRVGPDVIDFMINGDNNTIGDASRNVVIQGNNNRVAPRLRNVTITGTSNVTVEDSNVTYQNGVRQSQRGIVDGGLNTVTPLDAGTTTRLVDSGNNVVQNDSGHSDIYTIDGNG